MSHERYTAVVLALSLVLLFVQDLNHSVSPSMKHRFLALIPDDDLAELFNVAQVQQFHREIICI